MRVSVIIPTYNRARMVAEAVASVLAQSVTPLEVIVIDDGSTDDTFAALRRFGSLIRTLRTGNRGVSAARNTGVSAARGDWIAFLDSDDLWQADKLSRQVRFLLQKPGAVAGQTGEIWIRDAKRVNPCAHHAKPSGEIFEDSLERCLVSPSAVMLRRDIFLHLGGFDEGLPACEDYDLWLRLGARFPVWLLEEPLVVKRGGHADQLSRRHWGMDRFRVASMARLLASGELSESQRLATQVVAARKCRILEQGALRRGKLDEASRYQRLRAWIGSLS